MQRTSGPSKRRASTGAVHPSMGIEPPQRIITAPPPLPTRTNSFKEALLAHRKLADEDKKLLDEATNAYRNAPQTTK